MHKYILHIGEHYWMLTLATMMMMMTMVTMMTMMMTTVVG